MSFSIGGIVGGAKSVDFLFQNVTKKPNDKVFGIFFISIKI